MDKMSHPKIREWNLQDPDSLSVTFFPGELARLLLSRLTNKRPSHEVARTGAYVITEHPITTSVTKLTDEAAGHNARARAYALRHTVKTDNLIPATVSYQSQGRLLLVGPEDRIRRAASLLPPEVKPTLLVTESVHDAEAVDLETIFDATASLAALTLREPSLTGYLGQFQLTGLNGQGERIELAAICFPQQTAAVSEQPRFDLVADLGCTPLFALERPPVGYLSLSDDTGLAERLAGQLAELCALTGIFDKPRYFRLDPEACAFTARGVPGCSRCLDVCPTDALKPVNGRIQIDPHLCQGFGSCATACPTGAIAYHQPDANTSGDYLLRLLKHYREAGGEAPQLLIAAENEREWVESELTALPANWLPVWVEESASLGIESWFAALAYGASAVRIALGDDAPASVRALVERELASAAVLLAGAGLAADRIALFNPDAETDKPISCEPAVALLEKPLKGDKRENLFAAFDALWQANEGSREPLAVPHGAPYGSVELKESDCTLCMGCVAVCPSRALHAVGHTPGLNFIEQDCIQCGMCEKACPEQAIVLTPRLQPVPEARHAVQSLKAEEAACCIRCGKPFAPASLIRRIQQKLAGHSHFQNEAAARLLMCEECRVKDVFTALAADPAAQLKI
jgi:ferredoxin